MIANTLVIAALPVGGGVIIAAAIVLAVVLAIGSFWLLRSGKKKGAKPGVGAGASDWQRQGQQGAWGQQGMGGQGGQGGWGQQPNPWAASNPGQQQQQPGGWGQPAQQQPGGWGQPAQQQPGGWGQPDQQAGGWGQPAQQAGGWGQPDQQQAGGWGQPAQSAAPTNAWGQPQAGPAWDAGQPAAQPQQAQTAYGGAGSAAPAWNQQPSFGGQSGADAWGAPAAQAGAGAAPAMPSWQQGGFGQGAPGMMQDAQYSPDSDKTMLRTTGPQGGGMGGVGMVRVEEGKEPGRVYEVRKDSLSIGRSRESDIFLEDLAVSRLHASIVNIGNGNYALKDEGSANGTKVNGQLVNKYQTYPLQEGDRIQLGQTVLVFARR